MTVCQYVSLDVTKKSLHKAGFSTAGTKCRLEKRILKPMLFEPIKRRALPKPLLVSFVNCLILLS